MMCLQRIKNVRIGNGFEINSEKNPPLSSVVELSAETDATFTQLPIDEVRKYVMRFLSVLYP